MMIQLRGCAFLVTRVLGSPIRPFKSMIATADRDFGRQERESRMKRIAYYSSCSLHGESNAI